MKKNYYDNDAYRAEFMECVYSELADDTDNCRANRIIDMFDSASTADVVEVVHGEWVPNANGENELECSVCRWAVLSVGFTPTNHQYCPHCGAKMDGRATEQEGAER